MRFGPSIALIALALGCAAQRVVPPPAPAIAALRAERSDVGLHLRSFGVHNRGQVDRPADVERLRERFLDYLAEPLRYGDVVYDPEIPALREGLTRVPLDVSVLLDYDDHRSYIFDLLFFYPFLGLLPITPIWGDAGVSVTVWAEIEGAPTEIAKSRVSVPWSLILYSYYRTAPIEDAYARAYRVAFEDVARQIAARLPPPALVHAASTATTSVALVETSTPTLAETSTPTLAETSTPTLVEVSAPPPPVPTLAEAPTIRLEEDGFGLIITPRRVPGDDGWLLRYLKALGGIEGAYFRGRARVASRAMVDRQVMTLASGDAYSEGFKISFFTPPDRTGFFFPPTIGFLSQDITIEGFVDDVPIFELPGAETIPAVVSDPETGMMVDPNDPIAYALRMRAGFIGQQVGLNLVGGNEWIELWGTLRVGINLLEYRYMGVELGASREEGGSFTGFQSGLLAAQVGLTFPTIHLALRASGQLEWYIEFDYPAPVDFLGKTAFNPAKKVFERQRVFIEGAELLELNAQVSAVVLF